MGLVCVAHRQDEALGDLVLHPLDIDARPQKLIGVFQVVGGKFPSTATSPVSSAQHLSIYVRGRMVSSVLP